MYGTLKRNYVNGFVDILMLNYIKDALLCFQHPKLTQPLYSPHSHTPIQYRQKGLPQLAPKDDWLPAVNKIDTKYVQSVIGTLHLYTGNWFNHVASTQCNSSNTSQVNCKYLSKIDSDAIFLVNLWDLYLFW